MTALKSLKDSPEVHRAKLCLGIQYRDWMYNNSLLHVLRTNPPSELGDDLPDAIRRCERDAAINRSQMTLITYILTGIYHFRWKEFGL